jgi:ABC-type transporter Mla MlaB component
MNTAALNAVDDKLILKGDVRFETVVQVFQNGLQSMHKMNKITVDLGGLIQCDSSILALCSAWVREVRSQKKEILFINLPSFVKDLVKVHGLDLILPVS